MRTLRTLPILVLLLAALPASPEDEAPPPAATAAGPVWQEPGDPVPVPQGSAADQALWKAASAVSNRVTASRYQANTLSLRTRNEVLFRRLEDAAQADPDASARYLAIAKKLANAQVAMLEVYTSRWPVDPTRGCQMQAVELGSAMNAAHMEGTAPYLAEARDRTRKCVDLATAAVTRQEKANGVFAEAVAEARQALPPMTPVTAAPAGAKK